MAEQDQSRKKPAECRICSCLLSTFCQRYAFLPDLMFKCVLMEYRLGILN